MGKKKTVISALIVHLSGCLFAFRQSNSM